MTCRTLTALLTVSASACVHQSASNIQGSDRPSGRTDLGVVEIVGREERLEIQLLDPVLRQFRHLRREQLAVLWKQVNANHSSRAGRACLSELKASLLEQKAAF